VTPDERLGHYRVMVRIRLFELAVSKLYRDNEIPGFVHTSVGQEAIAEGVCSELEITDYITSTHRGHGHCIAKGMSTDRMMAELFGKSDGYCGGRGGSMHVADPHLGILGANGIVGAGQPIAVGAALACKVQNRDAVVVSFLGDGAANQGNVHEAMNLAAVWHLPLLFVLENNGFAEFSHQRDQSLLTELSQRAAAYGFPGMTIDGNDFDGVAMAVRDWRAKALDGGGPMLLEGKTYRIHGHYEGDPMPYRDSGEAMFWKQDRDPLLLFRNQLLSEGVDEQACDDVQAEVAKEIEDAVTFSRQSPWPDISEVVKHVYAGEVA
jgi:TPP-dependent pyruvate/acetoin dehydrogenase alpha subunit